VIGSTDLWARLATAINSENAPWSHSPACPFVENDDSVHSRSKPSAGWNAKYWWRFRRRLRPLTELEPFIWPPATSGTFTSSVARSTNRKGSHAGGSFLANRWSIFPPFCAHIDDGIMFDNSQREVEIWNRWKHESWHNRQFALLQNSQDGLCGVVAQRVGKIARILPLLLSVR